MKRCPQCGREYDATMMFCLDDGAKLRYGPASVDEPVWDDLRDDPRFAELVRRIEKGKME